MKFLIISGLSGAGKSTALHALEDIGYQCIDNLPLELLETFIEQISERPVISREEQNIAVSLDIRVLLKHTTAERVKSLIDKIKDTNIDIDILFLSADDDVLIRRYQEAGRTHPLAGDRHTIAEAVELEKVRLDELSMLATYRIDTSSFNPYRLRESIFDWCACRTTGLLMILQSFSYKKGVPYNADYVFDARVLLSLIHI